MKIWIVVIAIVAFLPGCRAMVAKRPSTPAAALPRDALDAEPVPEDERYFLLLFGSESEPKRAVLTHTWATVVRQSADGAIIADTISWMPRTLVIRPFRFHVEPGVNLDLAATMKLCEELGEKVTLFGPREIPARVYRRLLVQKSFLESDAIGYQGFDLIGEAGRLGNGSNCIHAITDADPKYGRAGYLLAGNGVHATRYIRDVLKRRDAFVPPPEANHDHLLPALGLDPAKLRRG